MTAESPLGAALAASGRRGVGRGRVAAFAALVWRQTLRDPVASGRLRDLGWPRGLGAIVLAGYAMFAFGALLVAGSGLIRAHATLLISSGALGLPVLTQAPLVLAFSFGVACFATAALHGPWWLRILGLLFALIAAGVWCVRGPSAAGSAWWLLASCAVLAALVLFAVLRWRRRFAWWEFLVLWALVGAAMVTGVVENRYARVFGADLNPLLLQQTASTLGFLALPAAMVAGASVAEVSVRATVAATAATQRLSGARWAYAILAAVLTLRVFQTVRQVAHRDPVSQGLVWVVPAVVLAAAFAGLGMGLARLSRRAQGAVVVSELGDDLARISFGVAATLVAVLIPVQVILAGVQLFGFLLPDVLTRVNSAYLTPLVGSIVDPARALFGLVLILLAVRAARRGRLGPALLTGCVGIMLVAAARQLVLGDATSATLDPDALNLVGTVLVVFALLGSLVRRRLTRSRALGFSGLLILAALFSYRDFISDPLGAVLGFSGAALVLFGLTWDLLTGAGWGNGQSRRFPREVRVLLVLTNAVLTMTVLAYAALVRDGGTTILLEPYAEYGNLIFGTALLAAAAIGVFGAAARDRPVR